MFFKYDNSLKKLTRAKVPGPDNITIEIIKASCPSCQDMFFLFFQQCFKHSGNTIKNILLHKKTTPNCSQTTDQSPQPTQYKVYMSTLTSLLPSCGEKHGLLHFNQEVIRSQQNITRQIQVILATLEDTKLTNKDIHLTCMDFEMHSASSTTHDY